MVRYVSILAVWLIDCFGRNRKPDEMEIVGSEIDVHMSII